MSQEACFHALHVDVAIAKFVFPFSRFYAQKQYDKWSAIDSVMISNLRTRLAAYADVLVQGR